MPGTLMQAVLNNHVFSCPMIIVCLLRAIHNNETGWSMAQWHALAQHTQV